MSGSRGVHPNGQQTRHWNVATAPDKRTTERVTLVGLSLAYSTALLWAYTSVISPAYAYEGYLNRKPSVAVVAFALLLAALPCLWLPKELCRLSAAAVWVLYLIAYVPGEVIPMFSYGNASVLIPWGISLAGAFGLMSWIVHLPHMNTFEPNSSFALFWTVVGSLLAVSYALALGAGLSLGVPNLADTYIYRAAFVRDVASQGLALGYVVPWAGNVLNPLLISWGIVGRKPILLVAGVLGEVALFFVNGSKAFLALPVLVVILHVASRNGGRRFGRSLLITWVLVVVASQGLVLAAGNDFVSYTVVRRVLVTPGVLAGRYVEFFSANEKTLFSDSALLGVVTPRYSVATPQLIGGIYFGPGTGANASVFADGFAGLGLIGVLVLGLFTGMVLRILDSAALGRRWTVMLGVAGALGFALSQSALSTTVLTHGLVLAIVLALLLPISRQDPSFRRAQTQRSAPPAGRGGLARATSHEEG